MVVLTMRASPPTTVDHTQEIANTIGRSLPTDHVVALARRNRDRAAIKAKMGLEDV